MALDVILYVVLVHGLLLHKPYRKLRKCSSLKEKAVFTQHCVLSGYMWHTHTPTHKIHHHCQELYLTIFLLPTQGDLLPQQSK